MLFRSQTAIIIKAGGIAPIALTTFIAVRHFEIFQFEILIFRYFLDHPRFVHLFHRTSYQKFLI